MTSNYQFLAMLHRELEPRGYLEIGVRFGDSLKLAQCPAIGIDPAHQVSNIPAGTHLYPFTSDRFFETHASVVVADFPIDLVYIDGMHLYEYALRDFINVVKYANERTVIVFDDTHPYSQSIATREQPPGDWTGDVWKTMNIIQKLIPDLQMAEVDVSPTGAFVVWGFDHQEDVPYYYPQVEHMLSPVLPDMSVPDDVLDRRHTITPEEVIKRILESRT